MNQANGSFAGNGNGSSSSYSDDVPLGHAADIQESAASESR